MHMLYAAAPGTGRIVASTTRAIGSFSTDAAAAKRYGDTLSFVGHTITSFIDGKIVGASAHSFEQEDPARGIAYATKFEASDDEVADAIANAKEGQKEWGALTGGQRSKVLLKAAEILHSKVDLFARLECLDTARPFNETLYGDIDSATDCLEYMAREAGNAMNGHHVPLAGGSWGYTTRQPLGVCAGIGAWNYPLQSAAWKSAAALAAGNAMVFKPAPQTPLTAIELGKVYLEAGVPRGVFNVVLGESRVGNILSSHTDIKKVSFTGSVNTGKAVYAKAAESLKPVTMELGGKSPLIVFDDADLEDAVSGAMMGNWYSNGEVCSNGTRVYVQEGIKERFVERLIERTNRIKIGDPMRMDTQIGALISEQHMNKVLQYIELGVAEGAELIQGGGIRKNDLDGELSNGYFLTPAIFDNCCDDMTIAKEEIFGMVMSVFSFSEDDEVVSRANNSSFGLSAGVFTSDIRRAHRVAHQVEAGNVWINNYNLAPVELPWLGTKNSGLGYENGMHCLDQWSKQKGIYVEMGQIDSSFE